MGIIEEGKGKIKETVGDVTNNPQLQEEGYAQKEKGRAERAADQERAEAKVHEAEAKEKEFGQRAAESAK
jgi:uncharacterized protein YjbJ (UPF0337 family)